MNAIKRQLLILFPVLLTGCYPMHFDDEPYYPPVYSIESVPIEEPIEESIIEPLPEPYEEGPKPEDVAVDSLLQEAEAHKAEGDYDLAAAKLERAARIEPRNANIWYELALVRFEGQQHALAKQLAEKALLLAKNNLSLQGKIEALLANIASFTLE